MKCQECGGDKIACRGLCWSCYSRGRRSGKWGIRYDGSVKSISHELVCWMAGFFDGEGSVSLYIDTIPKVRLQIQIQITCSVEKPIKVFSDYFGGNVFRYQRKPSELPMYKWALTSAKRSKVFLETLFPYMQIKGEVSRLALEVLCIQVQHKPIKGRGYSDAQISFFQQNRKQIMHLNRCS